MKETQVWSCALLLVLLTPTTSLSSEHSIVFPRMLETRDSDGQKTLIVNEDITLKLTPSSVFAKEFTVDTIENGSPVKYYFQGSQYEKHLYRDKQHKAAVTIRTNNGVEVEGLIGTTLRIKPAPGIARSLDGHVAHVLYEVQPRVSEWRSAKDTMISASNKKDISESDPNRNVSFPAEREDSYYVVEVFLVLDKYYGEVFAYKKSEIMDYLSRFMTSVNLYLTTLSSIRVKIVGVKIDKKRSSYMQRIKDERDKLLADQTLEKFQDYYSKRKAFKDSDLFILLTRLNIVEGDQKSYNDAATGISNVGGACTNLKAGMCEDEPKTYDGVYGFVRQVSHLLGIVNDGSDAYTWIEGNTGARHCRPSDGYIMGTPNPSDPSLHYRHYYFSTCSQYQFETFVRLQDRRTCLTKYNFQNPTQLKEGIYPGQYDMPYICKILHDDYQNVFFVPEPQRQALCRFRCRTPKDFRNRSIQFDHFIEEGASCEEDGCEGRVCIQGVCQTAQ